MMHISRVQRCLLLILLHQLYHSLLTSAHWSTFAKCYELLIKKQKTKLKTFHMRMRLCLKSFRSSYSKTFCPWLCSIGMQKNWSCIYKQIRKTQLLTSSIWRLYFLVVPFESITREITKEEGRKYFALCLNDTTFLEHSEPLERVLLIKYELHSVM